MVDYDENSLELANETISTSMQGTAISAYGLRPVEFIREIVEAAKVQLYFREFIRVMYAPEGVKDVSIPKHNKYLGNAGVTLDSAEATDSDISNTVLNSYGSVTVTPTPHYGKFTITDYAARTNLVNLVEAGRDELTYAIGETVELAIVTAINAATVATNSVVGAQTIYGGTATSDSTLALGDVLTTDMVAQAARLLKDKKLYYWNSTTFTKAGVTKNPWANTADDPFVLFISPSQEEVLRKDSQFVNAAEYGSNVIVQNGEIGQYLGIRIVVTPLLTSTSGTSAGPDGTNVTSGVTMTRCILMKGKKAAVLVWGQEPMVEVARIPWRAQKVVVLQTAYAASAVQADAIVFLDVSDY